MKTWKIIAMIGLVVAFTAAAQAESSYNEFTANKLSANKLSVNKLAGNKLAGNRLSANRLAGNKLARNNLIAHSVGSSLPGEGTARDIVAIELPDGLRLAR
jgi:hypothetical protein